MAVPVPCDPARGTDPSMELNPRLPVLAGRTAESFKSVFFAPSFEVIFPFMRGGGAEGSPLEPRLPCA
jgi:hypothetical protein